MKKIYATLAIMWMLVICAWIFEPEEAPKVGAKEQTTVHQKQTTETMPTFYIEETEGQESPVVYGDVPLNAEMQIHMQQICQESNLSFEFALAMMESESGFDPEAVGDGGESIGYFQINSVNWPRMESEYGLDVSVPMDNITAGIKIMQELFEKYEDPYHVIMCYKCGEKRGTELFDQGIYTTKQFDCVEICLNATNYERSHGK